MDSIKTKVKAIVRKRRIPSAELLVGLDYFAYDRIPNPKSFFFVNSHPKKRPDALAKSLLPRLPIEIIHNILSFLPAASAGCFSISCFEILELVGKGYMDNVLHEKAYILAFVVHWARDLRSQVFCPDCKCLYKRRTLRYFLHQRCLIRACEVERQIADYRMMARGVVDCDRIFPMCPTRMDHFMLEVENPDPSIPMDKSRHPVSMGQLSQSLTENYINHVRADVASVDGSVMFRLQDTYLNIDPEKPYKTMFQTCRHIQIQINTTKDSIHAFKLGSATGNYWRTKDFRIADNDASESSASFDCPAANCDDKYHIQFERHAGQGILVSLTRRVNLGTTTTGKRWAEFCHVRRHVREADHTGRLVLTLGEESEKQHKLADKAYYIERYSLSRSAIREPVLESQRQCAKGEPFEPLGPRKILPNLKSEDS